MDIDKIERGDREQIIMALVKMRVEKYASQKTQYDFLTNQLGYKQSYAYELLEVARKRIVEIFKEEHEEAFQTAVSQLQEMIETAKDYRIRLEARKELNKLMGLHRPVKVEVSGKVEHQITGIDINIQYLPSQTPIEVTNLNETKD
jgi:plasmid maintenance system antidote protein VapI